MRIKSPKIAWAIIGLFVFITLADTILRSGYLNSSVLVCNPGIGLGTELPEIIMWPAIILVLAFTFRQTIRFPLEKKNIAWGGIFLGGIINAVDRYRSGCVTDYLHWLFFPSFNLADIMIFLGIMFLGFSLFRMPVKSKPYVS